MPQSEILAPAGGKEQLTAAVRSGADAVYLGAKSFNARQNAQNFENLAEVTSYCHARGVKVYVTVNTLVNDGELPRLVETAKQVAASGADGVIVQDLAAAKIFREHVPSLPLHASTQLTVHNLSGVKALEALGFSRIVLSRELSLDEIRKIASAANLEIEVFIHGSLCMCMSGACYLSSIIGQRSGNRGLCAQPCRLDFKHGEKHFALSLKDMSHIEHMDELIKAGVTSFKIEGRMKRPEYVAAAVTACRRVREGKSPDLETLKAVFSRSGFTDGYLTGKRSHKMFGHRTKDDVTAAAPVLKKLSGLYRNEFQKIPVSLELSANASRPSVLIATDGVSRVEVAGLIPEPAISRPLDRQTAFRQLSKTGGTPFFIEDFTCKTDGQVMLPIPELNRLRREALDTLMKTRSQISPHPFIEATCKNESPYKPQKPYSLFVRCQTAEQAKTIENAASYILPAEEITRHPETIAAFQDHLFAEIPQFCFNDEKIKNLLKKLKKQGVKKAVAENIGAVFLARSLGFKVLGGHGLNILNTTALNEYAALGLCGATLSFELSQERIKSLGGTLSRGILGYGFLPLMQMRVCPAKGEHGCAGCGGRPILRDRMGIAFPLLCHKKQYTTLLNSRPLSLAEKNFLGIDFMTLYFTIETPEECGKLYKAYQNKTKLSGPCTNGLYYREIR